MLDNCQQIADDHGVITLQMMTVKTMSLKEMNYHVNFGIVASAVSIQTQQDFQSSLIPLVEIYQLSLVYY